MAHPTGPLVILLKSIKQIPVIPDGHGGISVFTITRLGHHAAPQMGQKLHAVTDAQYGHTEIKNTVIRKGRIRVVNAGGPAGQDNTFGRKGLYRLQNHVKWVNFTIDLGLSHPPGDELRIL